MVGNADGAVLEAAGKPVMINHFSNYRFRTDVDVNPKVVVTGVSEPSNSPVNPQGKPGNGGTTASPGCG